VGKKTGANPTDRGKCGTKRHILTSGQGLPLSVTVTGANVHDVRELEALLQGIQLEAPAYRRAPSHLCLDAGYVGEDSETLIRREGLIPHIRPRGEEKTETQQGKQPRRWVVERFHSWLNRYRRLLVRWEKKENHYLGFVHLACAITVLGFLFPG